MAFYILISFVSVAVGWMAFYWETLILCCLNTFFPFYSHIPPIMSQFFLYSNSTRLDTVTQGLPWFYPWMMDRSLPLLKIMCILFHSQITPGCYDTMGMISLGQNFSLFQNEQWRHCWWFRWWWQRRKIRSLANIARNLYSFNSY